MMHALPDSSQRRQAIFTDKHAFVWAGAGTGKTTILTLRALAKLLWAPLEPEVGNLALYAASDRTARLGAARSAIASLLLLTFTRKAAAEMQARLFSLLDTLASRRPGDPVGEAGVDNPLLGEIVERLLESLEGRLRCRREVAEEALQRAAATLVELAAELQVSTLHGYTARLLSRYPIEACLPAGVGFASEDEASASEMAASLVDRWIRRVAVNESALEAALERVLGWTEFWQVRQWLMACGRDPWIVEQARFWRAGLGDEDPTEAMIDALDELERRFQPDPKWFRIAEVHGLLRRLNRRLKAGDKRAWAGLGARVVRNYEHYFPKRSVAGCIARMEAPKAQLLSRDGFIRAQAVGSLLAGFDEAWEAALQLMERFAEWSRGAEVRELGVVSFDQMIELAGELLSGPVGQRERARLRVILVDEFQDTDPAQLCLLESLLLSRDEGPSPIGFFVGDNKQSIYRFRGADLTHIHHFRERVIDRFGQDVVQLELVTNFRSTAELIRFANHCFSGAFVAKAGIQEAFQPLRESREASSQLAEMVVFDTDSLTVATARDLAAAETIRTIDAYLAESDEHRYRDVMVLVRANRDVDRLLPALERAGIAAVSAGTATYLRNAEVLDLINLLIVLINPADTLAAAAVLRSPLVCLSDEELTAVAGATGLEQVFHPERPLGSAEGLPTYAHELVAAIREVAARRASTAARRWLWEVADLLPSVLLYSDEHDVEGRTSVRIELLFRRFLDVLNEGRTAPLAWLIGQRSRVMRAGERDANLGEDVTVIDDSVDAVRVLTVHKAKGLEAKCTIVFSWNTILAGADATSLRYQPFVTGSVLEGDQIQTFRGIDTRFGPLTIETQGVAEAKAVLVDHERAEAVRLAYVAATRARDRLVLITPEVGEPAEGGLLDTLTRTRPTAEAPCLALGGALSVRLGSTEDPREVLAIEVERVRPVRGEHASYWRQRLEEASGAADAPILWSATMAHRDEAPPAQGVEVGAAPEWSDLDEGGRTLREEAMARGVLVHAYLEHHVTEERFEVGKLSALGLAEDLPTSGLAFEQASAILTAFYEGETRDADGIAHRDRIQGARILGREVPFFLDRDGASWTGVMDLVIEQEGRIISVDYKATPRREIKKSYHTQRELYTEALGRVFPDREIGFEFFWLWTDAADSV